MDFDFNKIVSANEISADTQQIMERLSAQGELLVFDNNKPQFAIVSLEQYERLQRQASYCNNVVTDSSSSDGPVKKIGELVRETLEDLIRNNALSQEMVDNLCDPEYSKETFGLTYPVLKAYISDGFSYKVGDQKRDHNGYNRYYSRYYTINGGKYLLCSQWTEAHRKKYILWLEAQNR